jgi:hypothetical protein
LAAKRTIFISYSHEDTKWLDQLRTAMAPLTNGHRLDVWDDQRMLAGANWRDDIKRALATCNAAVLLVSQAFFASTFISQRELPAILRRRKRDGIPLVWIPVSASNFRLTPLRDIQAACDPSRPLDSLPLPRRKQALVTIVNQISAATATSGVGDVLKTTDLIAPAIMAAAGVKRASRPMRIKTVKRDGQVELHTRDGQLYDVIGATDVSRLAPSERDLIATYQASMAAAFKRWRSLYPSRGSLTAKQRSSLRRAQLQMCEDLGRIIDFMSSIGKYLPDHYMDARSVCSQRNQVRQRSSRP